MKLHCVELMYPKAILSCIFILTKYKNHCKVRI